jgi:hypothetical protein
MLVIVVLQKVAEEEVEQIKGNPEKPEETIKNLREEEQRVLENKIQESRNQGIKKSRNQEIKESRKI